MENADMIALLQPVRDALDVVLAKLAQPVETKPTPAPVGRVPDNPSGAVAGLNYTYHEATFTKLPDFATLVPMASGTVTQPTLAVRKRDDFFALRFTGFVSVPADGEYTFYTSSDDGSRLYIGTALVVDNDGGHAVQERSGKITLQKGLHALTIDYYEYNGDQQLSVSYSGPNLAKTGIPASAYFRLPIAASATATVTAKPLVDKFTAKAS